MKSHSFRAWYRPKTILIVSDMSEHPVRTLEVISKVQATGARLFLLPLQSSGDGIRNAESGCPYLVSDNGSKSPVPLPDDTRRALLWAEILSESVVLKSARFEQVPELAKSISADIVVLVAPDSSFTQCYPASFEIGLLASLDAPVLIFGKHSDLSSWDHNEFRTILLPTAFGPGLEHQLRFACRLAHHYHARLTVLHVFEGRGPHENPWERTPVAVESKLPIGDLKREGLLCPMEIAVCEGYPEQAILRFNERKHHDLIILGGPRPSSLRRFGHSVVEGVMAQAHCPIVMIGQPVETGSAAIEQVSQMTSA
jgi:nucleotide-binding universal stress UspA family protein